MEYEIARNLDYQYEEVYAFQGCTTVGYKHLTIPQTDMALRGMDKRVKMVLEGTPEKRCREALRRIGEFLPSSRCFLDCSMPDPEEGDVDEEGNQRSRTR